MKHFATLLLGLGLVACAAPPPAPEPTETPSASATPRDKKNQDQVTEAGRTVFRTLKGKPWLMEAFRVRYIDGQQKAELKDVDWTLSDPKGAPLVRIKAPKAVYLIEGENVEFQGTVRAWRYPTKDLLQAGKMVWEGKTGVLRGSEGVTWTRGKTMVKGDTATTNDQFEKIVVEGNVHVKTVLEGDPFDSGG